MKCDNCDDPATMHKHYEKSDGTFNEIIVGFMANYTPRYMTDGAACFDIQSANEVDCE